MAKLADSRQPGHDSPVSRLSVALFLFLLFAVAGGAVFLLTWDIPAPLQEMRQVVPNDRFPA
ncbi:MAG: hypothetical protein O2905_04750 [Proteobacteria bacterium]|nr:hypothetical protein [Pseudomonadota bacterium]